jgi:ATP-dependent RNA helicase DDX31/DBP7
MSTCDSVDFHHTILSQLEWSPGQQLDMDKKQKFFSCKVFHLHGNMDQEERKKSFLGFGSEKSAILVSTDLAARGLDFPKVKYIIQYDSPGEASEYVHRYLKYLLVSCTCRFLVYISIIICYVFSLNKCVSACLPIT